MGESALSQQIGSLVSRAGFSLENFSIAPCNASGNNRVYRIEAGGRALVAKVYFRDPSDVRDRLAAEYSFLRYAHTSGIKCVPKPVACDPDSGIALYQFVDGFKLLAKELNWEHLNQALEFFLELNDRHLRNSAAELGNASEASFSITSHLQAVDGRVVRLASIPVNSEIDREATEFVAQLKAEWMRISDRIKKQCSRQRLDQDAPINLNDRCMSPSDFGFHNAIVTKGGRVVFIDFEYAGWDDPAKTISDFFCQPAVPVPAEHYERFLGSALAYAAHPEFLSDRTRILSPLFRLKWGCIMLNDFLPDQFKRRKFADPSINAPDRKRTQLDKARQLLFSI